MRSPDYALLEELVRKLLDDLRNAHFLLARNTPGEAFEPLFAEARATHARLAAALPLDPDRARALGYILADVLGERIASLDAMAREPKDSDAIPKTQRRPLGDDTQVPANRDATPRGRGTLAPNDCKFDD